MHNIYKSFKSNSINQRNAYFCNMDESVMQKYNISIIKSKWLAVVSISFWSNIQHMLDECMLCLKMIIH